MRGDVLGRRGANSNAERTLRSGETSSGSVGRENGNQSGEIDIGGKSLRGDVDGAVRMPMRRLERMLPLENFGGLTGAGNEHQSGKIDIGGKSLRGDG